MVKEVLTDYVYPLLKQLEDAKQHAARNTGGKPVLFIENMLKKMEREVRFMDDVFRRLERWEKDVKEELGAITKFLDDMLADCSETEVFQFRLQNVNRKISELKEHVTPPLHLPMAESRKMREGGEGEEGEELVTSSSLSKAGDFIVDELGDFTFVSRNPPGHPLNNTYVWQKYKKMKPQLRECLLTLSIFPKVSVLKKRLMIYWWIGEGIATATGGFTAEEVGEHCFEELVNEGLITPIFKRHNLSADRCTVPLWIRDELIFLSVMVGAFSYDCNGLPSSVLSSSPRGCLLRPMQESQASRQLILVSTRFNPYRFLTCFNVNQHNLSFGSKEFMAMRNAAVLQLGSWRSSVRDHIEVKNTKFLECLGSFKNLRYLSLRGISRITELPASVGELTNLRILDLRACHNLERLPMGLTKLKSLAHLDASECCLLEHMPRGLGSLSELQVLKGFVIGNNRSKDTCQLCELGRLEKLRKLSINIGHEAMVAVGEFNELGKFKSLRSLTMTWGQVMPPLEHNREKPTLSRAATTTTVFISPPPRLEKLDLRCFPGSVVPNWLDPGKLRSLKRLYFRGGRLHKVSGQKWSVEVLRLRFLGELDMEESELMEEFPNLVYFEAHECSKLRNISRRFGS